MAEGARIETRPPLTRRRMSRRQFIVGSTKRVGALAVGAGTLSALARNYLYKPYLGEKKESSGSAKPTSQVVTEPETQPSAETETTPPRLFDKVFHDLSPAEKQEARDTVDRMKRDVLQSNPSYEQMLAVTRKFAPNIRQETEKRDILPQSGIGIVFVENGGGEDQIHPKSGARGVAQLMEDTARQYGMIVAYDWKAGGLDERTDPAKSIKVMAMYLRDNKELLVGDTGLAIWSYHAGIGNVMEALRNYFLDYGIDVGDYSKAFVAENQREMARIQNKVRQLILEHKVNVHKVLRNRAVANIVLPKLDDESEWYVYKAVAAAELFAEEQAITV